MRHDPGYLARLSDEIDRLVERGADTGQRERSTALGSSPLGPPMGRLESTWVVYAIPTHSKGWGLGS